jgi:malonyl CoA-acyl carrier protein transacylase
MGAQLFKKFPHIVAQADAELGYSIERLCLEDPSRQLNNTAFTQPAVYVVDCLAHLNQIDETGLNPHFVAGHSLGEYGALYAAGAFDFRAGLRLVQKRAALMSKAFGGGMAGVVGLSREQIELIIRTKGFSRLYVANLNTQQQIVISGAHDEVLGAQAAFEAAGAQLYFPLNVSGAFHSPFMRLAAEEFSVFLGRFQFAPLKIPVIANVNALPYQDDLIAENLSKQITHPVRWAESIQWLLRRPDPVFTEVGPGRVLTGMLTKIKGAA